MKKHIILILFVLLMSSLSPLPSSAEMEWRVEQTLKMGEKPVDTAMSARGTYLFVLTDDGFVHVYDSDGNIKGEFNVGKDIESIACGPSENILILKNRKKKEIQKIDFEFVEKIHIEGFPYRGNTDAPVVIAVFSDYQ